MKKLLLGLGTIAATAAPIATAISCGKTEEEKHTESILYEVQSHVRHGWKVLEFDFNNFRYSRVDRKVGAGFFLIFGFGVTKNIETVRPVLHVLLERGGKAKNMDIPLNTYAEEDDFKVMADITEELNHLSFFAYTKAWAKGS